MANLDSRVLILGAAGMIGRKLAQRLMVDGALAGRPIALLDLQDVSPPEPAAAVFPVSATTCDLAEPGIAQRLIAARPDVIFHLAAVVSGEAEADLELGYRVNLDGTRSLLEAIRALGDGYRPRLVFASSLAVYGAPLPELVGDTHELTPLTSYGAQKAIGELLLADYSRRGITEGIGIRLPTICVRPGKPNRAASGFFSSIIREPLAGEEAVLPVEDDVRHWFASPRAAVGFALHAAALPYAGLGSRPNLVMPGVSATVGEQIDALRRIAGDRVANRIVRVPDADTAKIIGGWPQSFTAERATALGFRADPDFDAIIKAHITDERGGVFVA